MAGKTIRRGKKKIKLFPRGKRGILYFRMWDGTRDRWISTGTTDAEKAKKMAWERYEDLLNARTLVGETNSLFEAANKTARVIVQRVTGEELKPVGIADIQETWEGQNRDVRDLVVTTLGHYRTIARRFTTWCADQKPPVRSVHEIDQPLAKRYGKALWESGITPTTFNQHINHLSRVFEDLADVCQPPAGNVFARNKIARFKKSEQQCVHRQHLEPEQLREVLAAAVQHSTTIQPRIDAVGADRAPRKDLMVVEIPYLLRIGCLTGFRLKDAVLLEWDQLDQEFLEIVPYKTRKRQTTARVAVSDELRTALSPLPRGDKWVLPACATQYLSSPVLLHNLLRKVFDDALGENNRYVPAGTHRMKRTPKWAFHSLRVSFMSLLAQHDVSSRDAMAMLGWRSPEMVQLYEKKVEEAKQEADDRNKVHVAAVAGKIFGDRDEQASE